MFGRDISSAKQKLDPNDRRFWLNINYVLVSRAHTTSSTPCRITFTDLTRKGIVRWVRERLNRNSSEGFYNVPEIAVIFFRGDV